jgi:Protein of unknown function (DUF2281)
MSIEQAVIERLKSLPVEKQREVLDFVESLHAKNGGARKPLKSLLGLWADLGVNVTEEDFAQARREMWGNFPRDIEP